MAIREPDGAPEARVVIVGEPVEANEALFEGSLADARDYVLSLGPAEREGLAIVTEGRVFDPREL